MFEFVVIEDNVSYQAKVKNVINEICLSKDFEYEIKQFTTLTPKLMGVIKNEKPKIYILDIELAHNKSGLDIARMIRQKDWNSIIIITTSHNDMTMDVLKAKIMVLDFISKLNDFNARLKRTIIKGLTILDDKKTISFKSFGINYRIYVNDIVYIERDQTSKNSIIRTTYDKITIRKPLITILEKLPDNFYQTHRCCIVNLNKILTYDGRKNKIKFTNGLSTELVSRKFKKGVVDYANNK